jgi:outer membrane protein assembly factor BamB
MRRHIAIAIAGSLWLSGCGIGSWFTGGESNVEPPAPLPEFTAGAKVREVWSAELGPAGGAQFLKLAPLVRNDMVYVANQEGVVRALSVADGKTRWEQALESPVSSGIGEGDGLLFVGTRKGDVIAMDLATGRPSWRTRVSSEVLSPPTAQGGTVAVQAVDGRVLGLSVENGDTRWSIDRSEPALSLRGTAAPLIISGAVITGFANGKIAAIDLRTGRLLWETAVAEPRGRSEIERLIDVDSPPLVVGNVLFAAAYQGKIVAVSLENGRILWSRDVSTYSELDADGTNLYVSDEHGIVHALNLQSGVTVWTQEKLRARRLSAPAVRGKTVAVADYEGFVHWLAVEDGRFIARHQVRGGSVRSKPVATPSVLLVSSQGGVITALQIEPN